MSANIFEYILNHIRPSWANYCKQ